MRRPRRESYKGRGRLLAGSPPPPAPSSRVEVVAAGVVPTPGWLDAIEAEGWRLASVCERRWPDSPGTGWTFKR